jgi:hypothetical protein
MPAPPPIRNGRATRKIAALFRTAMAIASKPKGAQAAFLLADGSMAFYFRQGSGYDLPSLKRLEWMI